MAMIYRCKRSDITWYVDVSDGFYGLDGKSYTLVHWTRVISGSTKQYVGFVYSGAKQNYYSNFIKTFHGEHKATLSSGSIYQQGTLTSGQITGGQNYYNNELKLGVIELQWRTTTGVINGYFLNPTYATDITYEWFNTIDLGSYEDSTFWTRVKNLPKPKFPYELDISTTGGGKGTYDDDTSDNIGLPDLSLLNANSINNTKFITLYKMSASQLTHLADVLWSNNFLTQVSNTALKPMEFIISLQQFPINVTGVTKNIKAGRFLLNEFLSDNPVQGDVISGQFTRIDCGELNVKEKWGAAIDYQTDIQLFLPFIGTVSLSPQDVMASKIHVYYTVDLISGNCLASVLVKRGVLNSIIYQFNGNCSANYPITAENWSQVYSSLVSLSAGVAGVTDIGKSIASMPTKTPSQREAQRNAQFNFGRMSSEHMQGVGMEATGNLLAGAFAPSVQRTGALSSCVGFMGVKKPYLIISRLVQSLPKDFGYHKGYMSNVTMKLSDCKGFTQVRAMHLDNIIATTNEKDELLGLLEGGVIIK